MESTLLLLRVWQLPLSDGTRVFRGCVNRVADDETLFFERADEVALYLERCAATAPVAPVDVGSALTHGVKGNALTYPEP
ncbi:MAG TPA: hypothetical protein VFU71_06955 [Burkholderiaceae bacterium]|nr:hypothetical protein [Burkholderiaceae bacterium]